MKERPISYSPPMVLARRAGVKTQTRRAMRHQPDENWRPAHYGELHGYDKHGELTPDKVVGWGAVNDDGDEGYSCPYGKPGEKLWVREAWTTHACFDHTPPRDLTTRSIHYLADGEIKTGKYRPPMFMPRWASRGLDEIVSVRVERLQDISGTDAKAEGVTLPVTMSALDNEADGRPLAAYRHCYKLLWESINGPGSWDANPWVWVIEFKRIPP